MSKPKVLFLDIETSFMIAGVFGRFNQNISMSKVFQDIHMLCWAAAWQGDKSVIHDALYFHEDWEDDPTDDYQITESIWKLLDEADYVVAHNGGRFDVPLLNARFIYHDLPPPSTFQVVDTLRMARRQFKFSSNRLDDLGEYLKVGRKIDTDFELWADIVMRQDKESFAHMMDYNIQDVELLEAVYDKLRPWDPKHPSMVVAGDLDAPKCNACGSSNLARNGSYSTNTQTYQKYKCKDCGHNMRSRRADFRTKEEKASLLRSV